MTERPLIRPAFVVTESLATFVEINRVTLHDWYAQLRDAGEAGEFFDYRDFCACQYDAVCEEEAAKEPRYRPAETRSFEEVMEDMTGKPARGSM